MTLETNTVPELKEMAKELGLKGYSKLNKLDLMRLLEQAQSKASKSTAIKEIAKEQGVEGMGSTHVLVVDEWEDMKGVPLVVDDIEFVDDSGKPVQIADPLSSDEAWEEATKITEEVLEQPAGSMLVMNRHARRRAKALLRRKMKRVA